MARVRQKVVGRVLLHFNILKNHLDLFNGKPLEVSKQNGA